MEIVSLIEAREKGLKYFFTGIPCKNGHLSERFADGASRCRKCRNIEAAKRYASPTAKSGTKKYAREWNRKLKGLPDPTRIEPLTCECCGGPPTGRGSLHLDHDHKTGQFRGWLCQKCNHGLGSLGDNKAGVLRMLRYLENSIQ